MNEAHCNMCTDDSEVHLLCSSLYFACPSGGCVPLNSLCDGHSNCLDGADEALCTTGDSNVNNDRMYELNIVQAVVPLHKGNVTDGHSYFFRDCDTK